MAASADGPPSGVAAIIPASLGYPHYDVTFAAKVANLQASTSPSAQVGSRPSRSARSVQPTVESSQTRLFNADTPYTERDAVVLSTKSNFCELSCRALPGALRRSHPVPHAGHGRFWRQRKRRHRRRPHLPRWWLCRYFQGSPICWYAGIPRRYFTRRAYPTVRLFVFLRRPTLPHLLFRLNDRPPLLPPPLPSPTSVRLDFSVESLRRVPDMITRLSDAAGT